MSETLPAKPRFEGLDQKVEGLIYDTVRTGFRLWLYGVHSDNTTLIEEGSHALKTSVHLVTELFDTTTEDILGLVDATLRDDMGIGDQTPNARDRILAIFATGMGEAGGNIQPALELVEHIRHPNIKLSTFATVAV